jgi:hypothetical protein
MKHSMLHSRRVSLYRCKGIIDIYTVLPTLTFTKTSFDPSWRHSELQYNFAAAFANATTSISNFEVLTREAPKLLMQR